MAQVKRDLYWPACPELPQPQFMCAVCRQWQRVASVTCNELVSIERYQVDNSGEQVVVYWLRHCDRCLAREALDALA
jgi:hypothetical protein